MGYAEVAVNSPVAQRRTFTYGIPPGLDIAVGQAVWVPFGPRVLQGVVVQLTSSPAVEETRDIAGVIDTRPLLTPDRVELASWISQYYLAPLFDCIALMLPPGFERRLVTLLELTPEGRVTEANLLSPEERQLVSTLGKEGRLTLAAVEKALGKKKARQVVGHLGRLGQVVIRQELERPRVRPRVVPYVSLAVQPHVAHEAVAGLAGRAPRQAALLEFLVSRPSPVPRHEAASATGAGPDVVRALEGKGLVTTEDVQVSRDPLLHRQYPPSVPPTPTTAQEAALSQIKAQLRQPGGNRPAAFLLHGVTGSGKTEVYLRALAEAVALGKRGIVLVPEIALTPQTIERFAARFPQRVAVLHSDLSLGEQFDVWHQIREGAYDVVIGPRSAVFAPQPDLGLIVLDEEHEWAYKQVEHSPRYHAREVALKLAELTGAVVVMGSATPDVGTFHLAESGRYHLLQLPQRITVRGDSPLPEVEVVDMRRELKSGNRSMFSRSLSDAIAATLAAGQQTILFLNRRGSATFVQCRDCGFVLRCSGCDLPLTYHGPDGLLVCHQCNRRKPAPAYCPACWGRRIRYLGTGTQRVQDEVMRNFPGARTMRWDRDVTRGKNSHEHILKRFLAGEADILIGTQMLAKGLDFPEVTLVGIVLADTALHLPDFRACERTFQLLSQVAGRAGRGSAVGRVIVQTYVPEHYAIAHAAKHDYLSFYRQEVAYRRQHRYPPFSRLASLVFSHTNEAVCRRESASLHHRLKKQVEAEGLDIDLIGPSPMFFRKVRGHFRWQIIVRGPDPVSLLARVPLPQGWRVDVDPAGVL